VTDLRPFRDTSAKLADGRNQAFECSGAAGRHPAAPEVRTDRRARARLLREGAPVHLVGEDLVHDVEDGRVVDERPVPAIDLAPDVGGPEIAAGELGEELAAGPMAQSGTSSLVWLPDARWWPGMVPGPRF
jgi:hypothetical protein